MSQEAITALLGRLRDEGDSKVVDRLVPLVYHELHRLAHHQMARQRPGQTLDTTGLVHEAYLKIGDRGGAVYNDRQHFFRVAAMAMRQILVDRARRRAADKRGGQLQRTELDESKIGVEDRAVDIVELDAALKQLGLLDERLARVVEMRFFAGFSVEETAEALGVTDRTVKRDWRKARAYLYRELSRGNEGDRG